MEHAIIHSAFIAPADTSDLIRPAIEKLTGQHIRPRPVKGRFAPSPTGRMHLGNIFTALMSWLSARSQGGRWLLRIEDLDPQRSRADYARLIEDDLHWLGLEWDEGGLDNVGPAGPYSQSLRGHIYQQYLDRLNALGLTYPCHCTRAELMATQAPHQTDGRIVYPGTCRPARLRNTATLPDRMKPDTLYPVQPDNDPITDIHCATRIWVPDRVISYIDRNFGPQEANLAKECGDFVLRRADGAWAYQLAVVVDDALMGITEVVRGSDLLLSGIQQIYLYELLGFEPPVFAHLPLVRNSEGQRLSKRDHTQAMDYLREHFTAGEIIGQVAVLAGLLPDIQSVTPFELLDIYRNISKNHISRK